MAMQGLIDNVKSLLRELIRINKYNLQPIGYENLSVNSASVFSLTPTAGATYAEVVVESSVTASVPLRFLILGNNTLPTAANGLALNHLDRFDLQGTNNLKDFRIIRTGAGTYNVHIIYYK